MGGYGEVKEPLRDSVVGLVDALCGVGERVSTELPHEPRIDNNSSPSKRDKRSQVQVVMRVEQTNESGLGCDWEASLEGVDFYR